MINALVRAVFGTRNDRFLKKMSSRVQAINALEPHMQAMPDEAFPERIRAIREEIASGAHLDACLPEVFAMVREAGRRTLNMRHFDVQLLGGIALHMGNIAEMKTGEGKTLAATLPVVLNALEGKGVHVVTVNDYLAKRDAAWMGSIYSFLGLTVGVIVHGLTDVERQASYGADITYGTNNEFGFDYLRDNMKFSAGLMVQRGHRFAIVDEVDSILIDEARTPLIISGPSEESTGLYRRVDSIMPKLARDQHFTVDEKNRTVMLTDEGVMQAERLLDVDNLFDSANIQVQHHVMQSLKAHHIFKRDVDYIVADDQVVIVDEFTGRLMPGRRFSDGLHQALEAKENVKIAAENQTLASVTFQNYFRLYDKLAGMTGTADTEAVEFQQIYNLEVIGVPTNMPMIRKDFPDQIYRTREEKFSAIVQAIAQLYENGQPVLVGTISIETSELLSERLKKARIPHNVLNAKYHEQEAEIVAQAGQSGKVTIATNMAGRGTDIVLGPGVRELGGLHILGTERHESRRIDNQLRGRSGRQGDPGSSRFYLSLEDDLMRRFGGERLSGIMQRLGMRDGEPIEARMISRSIENAQRRVEGFNFEIRKTLLDYDNVMNQQREVIYSLRRTAMTDPDLETTVFDFLEETLQSLYAGRDDKRQDPEADAALCTQLRDLFNIERVLPLTDKAPPTLNEARGAVHKIFDQLRESANTIYLDVLRFFMLEELDRCWKEHLLNMDHLRDGIGLRGYGQRDPKQEYKREGFELFQGMLERINENMFRMLTRLRIEPRQPEDQEGPGGEAPREQPQHEFTHKEKKQNLAYSSGPSGNGAKPAPVQARRSADQVGRNDPCPCGSGKKYKKCCGQ